MLFRSPTHSIYFDEIDIRPNDDLFEAIYNYIPGATRTALINRGASTFVGDQEPLYMVNGFAKPKLFATSIPVSDIDFVDIFKGSSAARFGVLGAEGVIAIYTLDGADMISNTDPRTPRGITNLIHPGYSQARKFYEPGFEGDQESKKTGQLLATVYWEPTISLQEGTTVPVSFKTGDVAGRYRIRIEGITSKGQPLSFERIIAVRSTRSSSIFLLILLTTCYTGN